MAGRGQARIGEAPPVGCSLELSDDALELVLDGGGPVRLAYVDIEDVRDQDYVLGLTDHAGARYELTMFGRAYGQIVADLRKRRDAALERDLLLRGVNLQDTFPGKLFGGPEPEPVEIRVYEDLLVVVPQRGTMFGVPFSFVERVDWDQELYQIRVTTDDGATHVFGHLAKRSEEFRDELGRLLESLARRTAATLGILLPGLHQGTLSRLAGVMRDGRAVQQRVVDAIDPTVWPRLEGAAVGTPDLSETYQRLKAMTSPGWAAFGVKAVLTEQPREGPPRMEWAKAGAATDRESRSDWRDSRDSVMDAPRTTTTGVEVTRAVPERAPGIEAAAAGAEGPQDDQKATDLWYFCPLSIDGRPANVVAQEVASEGGHATYLFRLMEQQRFDSLSGEALADEVARGIASLNRALIQLNFRREPIYLSDEQIATGAFARYRVALRKLDYLRWARQAFLRRAIHNASWDAQVREALGRA